MGLNRSYSFEKMATATLFKEVRYTRELYSKLVYDPILMEGIDEAACLC